MSFHQYAKSQYSLAQQNISTAIKFVSHLLVNDEQYKSRSLSVHCNSCESRNFKWRRPIFGNDICWPIILPPHDDITLDETRKTGGQIYYYSNFNVSNDGETFENINDMRNNLIRKTVYGSVMAIFFNWKSRNTITNINCNIWYCISC